jgi:endonuclease/exonuclease/phosphatase family metal-dependent hydrolase
MRGPAGSAGPLIIPKGPARLVLIATTIAVLAQTLRLALPQFDRFSADVGMPAAVAAVLFTALAGFLAPVIRRVAGARALLVVGVGGLLVVRLAAQALTPRLWLAFAGAAIGMIAMAALYEGARGLSGVGFATATVAGLAVDTALRMTFATWDPVWQAGVGAWAACLVVTVLGGAALIHELSSGPVPPPGVSWHDALGGAALGPFLALQLLVLSSPAFVASSGWQSLHGAHVAVIVGQGLALAFLASGVAVQAVPGGVCVLGGTILGVAAGTIAGSYAVTGFVVVGVAIAGQVLSAWLLAVACRAPLRRAGTGGAIWRIDLCAAVGGLLLALLLLTYQLADIGSLPVPGNILPGLAGISLGGLAAVAAARGGPLPARAPRRALTAGAAALVLLAGTLVFNATGPNATRTVGSPGALRVVSYNINAAVNGQGRLDPEGIADTIETQRADVVLLQEVSRGSLLSGTTDVGVWLSRRLGMHLIWGPAADAQFGNAILTSRRVTSSGTARLPGEDWSRLRGYVWARLDVGGRPVDVWSTHLEDGAAAGAVRSAEISALLKAWGGAPRTIIGGDLNAGPGSSEVIRLTDGGLSRSLLDADAPPSNAEGIRSDWILGTDDLLFSDVEVGSSTASDHDPVAATVRIGR